MTRKINRGVHTNSDSSRQVFNKTQILNCSGTVKHPYLHFSWYSGQSAQRCHCFHSHCRSTLKEKGERKEGYDRSPRLRRGVLTSTVSRMLRRGLRVEAFKPPDTRPRVIPPAQRHNKHQNDLSTSSPVQTPTHFHACVSVLTTLVLTHHFLKPLGDMGRKQLIKRKNSPWIFFQWQTYYIKVEHKFPSHTGSWFIHVKKTLLSLKYTSKWPTFWLWLFAHKLHLPWETVLGDSLWRKIKPSPWNRVISGRKEKGGILVHGERIKACNIPLVSLEKCLLHPQLASSSTKMSIWLNSANTDCWAGLGRAGGACFLLTNTRLWFAHKLPMTHPPTGLSLCLKGQWGWEKPTGQQAGKGGSSSPHSTRWLSWKVTTPNVPFCTHCLLRSWKG